MGKNGRLSDAYFMAFFAKLRANRVQSVTSRPTVSLRHFQYDAVPFAIPVMALFCGQFLGSRIIVRFAQVLPKCPYHASTPLFGLLRMKSQKVPHFLNGCFLDKEEKER